MTMRDLSKPQLLRCSSSRRELIRMLAGGAGLLGVAAMSGCGADRASEPSGVTELLDLGPPRSRIAIIGGGIGGLATAYLCGPSHQVELFETRAKLGGHCDSINVEVPEGRLLVDLGAQFFHPSTHPLYVSLLSELGLYADGGRSPAFEVEGSLSVFPSGGERPYFASSRPLRSPRWAIDFAIFTECSRRLIEENGAWTMTVSEWIRGLPLSPSFKSHVLVPWLAALIGCAVDQIQACAARSIVQTFALSFPRNILRKPTTWSSTIGLGGVIDVMARACTNLLIYLGTAVERLSETGGKWFLGAGSGWHGPYDAVVVNAMPHASKRLIAQIPWAGGLKDVLERYEYFDTKLVIHRDPAYMPQDPGDWAMYNAGITSGASEGSIWLGTIRPQSQGRALQLFKSWAQRRSAAPREILAERSFRHALMTPSVIAATRRLRSWQGAKGLFFAGQYATGMDLQEAGVFAALRVAAWLSPESATLRSFQERLLKKGLSNISYDP